MAEALAPSSSGIAVATSIPPVLKRRDAGKPVDAAYQELCVRSWLACGFRVLSINHPDEIALLGPRFPGVTFVPTDRNASAWTGRKNPYIADLLRALIDAPEPVLGIVNSDIVLEPSSAWRTALPALVKDALVAGHRCDTSSLRDGTASFYREGIDWFFFDRAFALAAEKDAMPYAMGLPWWDYWLPAAAAAHGRRILVAERPHGIHLRHRQNYSDASWRAFAMDFVRFIVETASRTPENPPPLLSPILQQARDLAAAGEELADRAGTWDLAVKAMVDRLREGIKANRIALETMPGGDIGLAASIAAADDDVAMLFAGFDKRLQRSAQLHRAMTLDLSGQSEAALAELRTVYAAASGDFDVLLAYGEYHLRRGDAVSALPLLQRLAANYPDAPRGLSALGTTLYLLGRGEEAMRYFRESIEADPRYPYAYINLVTILNELGRTQEALELLERALEIWPGFARALELRDAARRASGPVQAS